MGAHLALALKSRHPAASVTAFDNLHRRGSELNLPRLREAGVAFAHGDVRSLPDLLAAAPAPDLILECSADPSARSGYGGDPDYLVGTNLSGCHCCLELARRAKSDFIFISTSRVYPYGRINALPYVEEETRFRWPLDLRAPGASAGGIAADFPLDGPRTLYGMTKLAAELMVQEYADAYGLRVLINRCGLLTGPWQMAKSDQGILAFWMACHYFKRDLSYIGFEGRGKQVRDFLHIDDFCDLILDQIAHFPEHCGRLYNVGGGPERSLSLLELTRLCAQITGNTLPVASEPRTHHGDVRIYISDNRQVCAAGAWRPRRDARTTLNDIFQWLRQEERALKPVLL